MQKEVQVSCVWGLLCSLSSIDSERNNISLFNVIDQINIPQQAFTQNTPFIIDFSPELVLLWRRILPVELCDFDIGIDTKISLVDPQGKVLQEKLLPVFFKKGMRNTRARVHINGLTLTVPGDYSYHVEVVQPGATTFTKALEIPFFVHGKEK